MGSDIDPTLEEALAAAGVELAAADAARAAALERVTAALRAADGTMPVLRMAQLAGVSRVTAYRLLGRR